MTIMIENPVSTSRNDLPEALTYFVHESIQLMDEKELKEWKRKSEKIMREARRRVSARPVVQPAGDEIRRVKFGER
jgi:hypothetical protein